LPRDSPWEVIDPTRWSFEGRAPYIAHIVTGDAELRDYDEGGDLLRRSMRSPCPPLAPLEDRRFALKLPVEVQEFVNHLLSGASKVDDVPLRHLHWIATAPFVILEPFNAEIYDAIAHLGWGGLIPIDNRRRARR
jgi:hypothetical protein